PRHSAARPRTIAPATQERVENDCAESGCPNPVQDEVTKLQGEVACTKNKCDGCNDEVAIIAEVHFIDDPDPGTCHCDQPENHYRHAAQHGAWNSLNQCAELWRKAEQDCYQRSNDEHQRGI